MGLNPNYLFLGYGVVTLMLQVSQQTNLIPEEIKLSSLDILRKLVTISSILKKIKFFLNEEVNS